MGVNQVYYGDSPLVDLTGDTVTPETLLQGETAHNAAGNRITGTARPESLIKDTVGWIGKNLIDISKTVPSKAGATITNLSTSGFTVTGNNVTYGGSRTPLLLEIGKRYIASVTLISNDGSGARMTVRDSTDIIKAAAMFNEPGEYKFEFTYQAGYHFSVLATFGSAASGSVTVDNVMIRRSGITDPTYESYHESVEVMYEEEIHGVNLFDDSKIEVGKAWNGDTNANRARNIIPCEPNSEYIVSMNGTNDLGNVFFSVSASIPPASQTAITSFPYTIRTGASDRYITLGFNKTNIALSDVTALKIMIRKADIEDPTYRPYNNQAIQNQLNAQGVLGAKNLIPYPYYSSNPFTSHGVTFTVDQNGIIYANGTNDGTETSEFYMVRDSLDKSIISGGILTGCPSGGSSNTYQLIYRVGDSTSHDYKRNYRDYGDGVIIPSLANNEDARIFVQIRKNTTVSNLTFKPMLRLASDPDDTYQPYAMTNRELTEVKNDLINHYPDYAWNNEKALMTNGIDLNNITTAGLYKCTRESIAATFNHCPVATAFGLEVINGNSDNTFVIQIIKYIPSAAEMYMRTFTGGSWTSWYKFTGTIVS